MNSPIVPPVFIVAFSGHRPKAGVNGRSPADLADCQPLIQQALARIQEQAADAEGIIHLLSSCAEGADLAACRAAVELRIPVHLVLPLPVHLFADDFKDAPDAWTEAQAFIEKARSRQDGWSLRIAKSSHERSSESPVKGPSCYADANHEILSHADALITVALDVSADPSSTSGAEQVWHDAALRQLPRININPATKILGEAIDLPRLTDPSDKRSGLKLLRAFHHHHVSLSCSGTADCLQNAKNAFSEKANAYADSVRNSLRNTILLHGSASLLAALALAYALTAYNIHPEKTIFLVLTIVAAVEFLLILRAELLHRAMHHKGEAWLECRAASEVLRMLIATRPHTDPLQTHLENHGLDWRRFALSISAACGLPVPFPDLEKAKAHYLKTRIENQIQYFNAQVNKALPKSRLLHRGMRWSAYLALGFVLAAIISKGMHWSHLHHHPDSNEAAAFSWLSLLLYFLPVALPLLTGIFLVLRQAFDLSRREHRFHLMKELLEDIKHDLEAAHTPFAFQQVISRTEQTLLNERLEFDVAQKIGMEH